MQIFKNHHAHLIKSHYILFSGQIVKLYKIEISHTHTHLQIQGLGCYNRLLDGTSKNTT